MLDYSYACCTLEYAIIYKNNINESLTICMKFYYFMKFKHNKAHMYGVNLSINIIKALMMVPLDIRQVIHFLGGEKLSIDCKNQR